jgi:hypothetical protein
MEIKYFLAKETIDDNDITALRQWLTEKPRLTKGSLTLEFENKWAKYIGTKYSVFCNSGSSANLLMVYAALMSGKLRNNKIVVPSVGWVTTVAPAMQFGMQPIMVGADKKTFGIDLDQLEQVCIKEQPSVVIFVQVLGVPHYKERLLQLKEKYGFILLEDACAALGARYSDGTMVGKDLLNNPQLLSDPTIAAEVSVKYMLDRCKADQNDPGYVEKAIHSVGFCTPDIYSKKKGFYECFLGQLKGNVVGTGSGGILVDGSGRPVQSGGGSPAPHR